jgi:hypothetical protein
VKENEEIAVHPDDRISDTHPCHDEISDAISLFRLTGKGQEIVGSFSLSTAIDEKCSRQRKEFDENCIYIISLKYFQS